MTTGRMCRAHPSRAKRKEHNMKQLGNLAIVCAGRRDVILTLADGKVTVTAGKAADSKTKSARWDDETAILKIIHALNFGNMAEERSTQ